MAEAVRTSELRPHPMNASIYTEPADDEHWKMFLESVREKGVLQALRVKRDGTVLVGHRRLRAAQQLQLETVSVEWADQPSDWVGSTDDWELHTLIHSNRFRRKSFSEMMREMEQLERIEKALAAARQGTRTDLGDEVQDAGGSRYKIGSALGVSGRQVSIMKQVWQAAKDNPHIAAKVAKIDSGQGTVGSAYNLLLETRRETADFNPRIYDKWEFSGLNPKYGQPHPGAIPGDIIENLLWLYTDVEDLVVDPFSGGGTTLDVCTAWDRRCIATDIQPRRPDIEAHDIGAGMPGSALGARLIFLDPPYWNMIAEDYSKDSASSLSMSDFMKFMKKLAQDCYDTVDAERGVCALIIMKQHFRLPEGIEMVDWPFLAVKWFTDVGFYYANRIVNVWPTSLWGPSQIVLAKETKRLLPVCGDLLVFKRK